MFKLYPNLKTASLSLKRREYTITSMEKGGLKKNQTNFGLDLLVHFLNKFIVLGLVICTVTGLLLLVFYGYFINRFYPNVSIANLDLTGKTRDQARQIITDSLKSRLDQTINFQYHQASSSTLSDKIQLNLRSIIDPPNLDQPISQAFEFGHKKIYFKPVNISIQPIFNSELDTQLETISRNIDREAIDSQIKVIEDSINVTPSQEGLVLDKENIKKLITDYLNTGQLNFSELPIKTTNPKLNYDGALKIKKRLDQIRLSPLKLTFKDRSFILDLSTILTMIDNENTQSYLITGNVLGQNFNISQITVGNQEYTDTKLTLNKDRIKKYLNQISTAINRPMQEPHFSFDGKKVIEFQPPQDGYNLDQEAAAGAISKTLQNQNQVVIALPVQLTHPKDKLTNDLGIKELLGRGISNFSGSIPNRIYNINLTAQKINGVLIPPGETFSFVNTVGDISAATGFKQAYVIKSGRTVLDDGGGVCQDSTTLFRAVLNAGLPVVDRTGHAYRVGYYEQGFPPGLDATVFYPSVDLKFKNDTPGHILIQAYTVGVTLYVDLYGSSDGRVAKLTTPVVTNQIPPPPELRQDDPTLPRGTVKQVDFSAWGANVEFRRIVTKNGVTIINEAYKTNYRPWQAIFMVGTKD